MNTITIERNNTELEGEELLKAAEATIRKSGLTLAELERHATTDSFPTLRSRLAWSSLQPLVAMHIL